jgi:HSP20 family molecular chaperone IbpA
VDVGQAFMENGMLHIDLTQSVPETTIKKIKIKRA